MKRLCALLTALFVLTLALPALATLTRVSTMGEQFLFIQDDYNIWTWTSTVNNYPRHLIVDHNGGYRYESSTVAGGTRVGMIVPFLKSSVIGAFVSDGRADYALTPIGADQRLDLFYGFRGTNFDLGLKVNWWGDKVQETGTQSQTQFGLNAGVGFNANGNMLELNGFYNSLSWTNEPLAGGAAINEKDAGNEFGLRGRYLYAYNNMVTLAPAIDFRTGKIAEKTTGTGSGQEYKYTMFDIGAGCNTVPLQGTEFLTSIGYVNDKETYSDSSGTQNELTTGAFYLRAGADIQVKNWLFFRVGANKYIIANEKDSQPLPAPGTETKTTFSDLVYHIGAGIMLGDVQFDVDVNTDWMNAGPYFLSGESAGDMFTYISFKYDFR